MLIKVKISIIGNGNVASGAAGYLAQNDHDVCMVKRSGKDEEVELSLNYDKKIKGVKSGKVTIPTTTNPSCCIGDSDITLVCISAKGHRDIGKTIKEHLKPETPTIFFPGKFASSYLLRRELDDSYIIGEVSSSLFYTTKTGPNGKGNEYEVNLMNKKSALEYAGIHPGVDNKQIMEMLNGLFGKGSFVNGSHPFRIALQNHDATINAVSVIGNENVANTLAVQSLQKGEDGVDISIYGDLSGFAARYMDDIFKIRSMIATELGFDITDPKEWLMGANPDNTADMDLPTMLLNSYGNKTIHVNDLYEDRRLTEDIPYGMVPLESLALSLGIDATPLTSVIDLANAVWRRGQKMKGSVIPVNLEDYDFRKIGYNMDTFGIKFQRKLDIVFNK